MRKDIPLVVTPKPDGGFTATSPYLPELVAEGRTEEEALANARQAVAAVIEHCKELGHPLPPTV